MFGAKVLPAAVSHNITRHVNAVINVGQYVARSFPKTSRKFLRKLNQSLLPEGYDVDVHFKPKYEPCGPAPVRRAERRSVQDDPHQSRGRHRHDRHLHREGHPPGVGSRAEADIVITATGLQLLAFGGVEVNVDGAPIKPNDKFAFGGYMLEGAELRLHHRLHEQLVDAARRHLGPRHRASAQPHGHQATRTSSPRSAVRCSPSTPLSTSAPATCKAARRDAEGRHRAAAKLRNALKHATAPGEDRFNFDDEAAVLMPLVRAVINYQLCECPLPEEAEKFIA